jgi:hypothetical protein
VVSTKVRPCLRIKCARDFVQSTLAFLRKVGPLVFGAETHLIGDAGRHAAAAAGAPRSADFRCRGAADAAWAPGDAGTTGDGRGRAGWPPPDHGEGPASGFGVFRRHVVIGEPHLEPEAGKPGAAVAEFRASQQDELESAPRSASADGAMEPRSPVTEGPKHGHPSRGTGLC